jgi:hypothetical protein
MPACPLLVTTLLPERAPKTNQALPNCTRSTSLARSSTLRRDVRPVLLGRAHAFLEADAVAIEEPPH